MKTLFKTMIKLAALGLNRIDPGACCRHKIGNEEWLEITL